MTEQPLYRKAAAPKEWKFGPVLFQHFKDMHKYTVRWPSAFGSQFTVMYRGSFGAWLMLNGRMFSFFKGANTGRWQVSCWANVWRDTNTPKEVN